LVVPTILYKDKGDYCGNKFIICYDATISLSFGNKSKKEKQKEQNYKKETIL
jgi:hypothetical protein